MINFKKEEQEGNPVEYWTAKQVVSLKETQAVLFSKYDRNYLVDQDLTDNKTWKVNWFGRHADAIFLNQLLNFDKLVNFVNREKSGQGYKKTPAEFEYPEVQRLKTINIKKFSRYNILTFENPPQKFHRSGIIKAYFGKRLLVQRGITQGKEIKGEIASRYESEDQINTLNASSLSQWPDSNRTIFHWLFH